MTSIPFPKPITAAAVREVLEAHGCEVVASNKIGIDAIDLMLPLLRMLQWVQWWGEMCRTNGKVILSYQGGGPLGMAAHSAEKDQTVVMVPTSRLEAVLDMPKNWLAALRAYGSDPEMRAERLADEGEIQLTNELLDENGKAMMHLLSLLLPAKPLS